MCAVVAMLTLVACGGSDDDDDTAQPAETTTTVAAVTTTALHQHTHETTPPIAKPLELRADGTIDPARVDLGGVEGVSPEQQARAEDLLRGTIEVLPKWSDTEQAVADGFRSIHDSLTGEEHFLHWDWIDGDDHTLDPNYPEALVYRVEPDGGRTLEAAMFILSKDYTFDNVPDIGGPLTQFHIHDNLCFTDAEGAVAGLTNGDGNCRPPLVKFIENPMVHVWIRANPCGPFAALQGVGAGQIREGEARACDADHGRLGL